ncbi:MAG TPA: HK97 family phage prohead protease [Longimicrobium sp.]
MSGRFHGYAAVWDRVDRAGDVIRRGAFAGAGPVPLRWRHGEAVGAVLLVEEDSRGLRVEAVGPGVRVGDG